MKNIILLFAAAMMLSLFSCGKDDTGGPTPTGKELTVQGDWNLATVDYAGSQTVSSDSTPDVITHFVGAGKDINMVFSFNNDDTYSSAGSYTIGVTSTVNGFMQMYDESFQDFLGTGTYEFIDPKITFTGEDINVESDIANLTEDSLEITALVSTFQSQFGITTVKHLNYTLSFTR